MANSTVLTDETNNFDVMHASVCVPHENINMKAVVTMRLDSADRTSTRCYDELSISTASGLLFVLHWGIFHY